MGFKLKQCLRVLYDLTKRYKVMMDMGVSENRVYTKNKQHFDGEKHDQHSV